MRPPDKRNPAAGCTARGASVVHHLAGDDQKIAPPHAPLKSPTTLAGRALARAHPVRPALADLLAELAGFGRAAA